MQPLFDYLKKVRWGAGQNDPQFGSLIGLTGFYDSVMAQKSNQSHALLRDQFKLISQTSYRKELIVGDSAWLPEDTENLYLWCLNAWARYQLFNLKNAEEADKILQQAVQASSVLFQREFKHLDFYKKQFPLVLAHNYVRLAYYTGQVELFNQRRFQFLNFFNLEKNLTFSTFPLELQFLLQSHVVPLRSVLVPLSKDYFENKIAHIGHTQVLTDAE